MGVVYNDGGGFSHYIKRERRGCQVGGLYNIKYGIHISPGGLYITMVGVCMCRGEGMGIGVVCVLGGL